LGKACATKQKKPRQMRKGKGIPLARRERKAGKSIDVATALQKSLALVYQTLRLRGGGAGRLLLARA
jgi:hypothetical protein